MDFSRQFVRKIAVQRLLQFLAGILNTGSFPDPVYPFTLTIESVYFSSI